MINFIAEAEKFLGKSRADAVAVAVVDFTKKDFESFEIYAAEVNQKNPLIYFDLASLTKPLTNTVVALSEKSLSPDEKLLLNHRAGLPAWGILDRNNWREKILNFKITESDTEYSDFSALRFMLELEQKKKISYSKFLKDFWDTDVLFWKDLDPKMVCLQNGYEHGKPLVGKVHDPNARNLDCFCSHAGLFGTIDGLAKTLLLLDAKLSLLEMLKNEKREGRFVWGFDTAQGEDTLAGKDCSEYTFGHLGFTGTSFWIDPLKKKGLVILSNATKHYWFDKQELNTLRRKLGEMTWQS